MLPRTGSLVVVSGKCWDTGTSDGLVFFDVTHGGSSRGAGITETDAEGNFSIDLGEDPGGFFDETNLDPATASWFSADRQRATSCS